MIFYRTKDEDGRMVIAGTQADARAVNKQFEQVDIPTDKAGLLATAQSWCDEVFELNKLMDEMRVDLEGCVPEREENEPAAAADAKMIPSGNISGGYKPTPGRLGPPPTRGSAVAPPPPNRVEVSFVEPKDEIIRQISVEEEIQNCDLPRLAVLAQNVAWRFEELGKSNA